MARDFQRNHSHSTRNQSGIEFGKLENWLTKYVVPRWSMGQPCVPELQPCVPGRGSTPLCFFGDSNLLNTKASTSFNLFARRLGNGTSCLADHSYLSHIAQNSQRWLASSALRRPLLVCPVEWLSTACNATDLCHRSLVSVSDLYYLPSLGYCPDVLAHSWDHQRRKTDTIKL